VVVRWLRSGVQEPACGTAAGRTRIATGNRVDAFSSDALTVMTVCRRSVFTVANASVSERSQFVFTCASCAGARTAMSAIEALLSERCENLSDVACHTLAGRDMFMVVLTMKHLRRPQGGTP
jgi:hypothetical protein